MDVPGIVRNFFKNDNSVSITILYGSFATARETSSSDVDIAIAGISQFPISYLAELNVTVSALVHREVDLVDLSTINGTILTQILTKGVLLKKTDTDVYAYFIRKMLYFQEDMAPNVRYILDYRREKFLHAQ